jgi:hypothetical protein
MGAGSAPQGISHPSLRHPRHLPRVICGVIVDKVNRRLKCVNNVEANVVEPRERSVMIFGWEIGVTEEDGDRIGLSGNESIIGRRILHRIACRVSDLPLWESLD